MNIHVNVHVYLREQMAEHAQSNLAVVVKSYLWVCTSTYPIKDIGYLMIV